jgi:hypothetical protein
MATTAIRYLPVRPRPADNSKKRASAAGEEPRAGVPCLSHYGIQPDNSKKRPACEPGREGGTGSRGKFTRRIPGGPHIVRA